jgi:hypothetical protein
VNWRAWLYEELTTVLPDIPVMGGGAMEAPPSARPFAVIRLIDNLIILRDGFTPVAGNTPVQVWVHDEPGSYVQIEEILDTIRDQLPSQVAEAGAHCCEWNGRSGDLADDNYKTITKYGLLTLVGSEQ